MSGYQGRPGPNVSQLLDDIRSNSQDGDFVSSEPFSTEDLDMFINADFTNFDMPSLEQNPFAPTDPMEVFDPRFEPTNQQPLPNFSGYNIPIQPAPSSGYALDHNLISPISPSSSTNPSRRVVEASEDPNLSAEDKAKLAAEEDKRRRNTAASARFRIKKKQREQNLEKTVKEINDENSELKAKLNQMEQENNWLKNLITEKNGKPSAEEFAAALQQFRKESEERDIKHEREAGAAQ